MPTLLMPTTITAQNGKVVTRNTTIAPSGCGVQVVGRRVISSTDYLTLKTFAAGRIVASGLGPAHGLPQSLLRERRGRPGGHPLRRRAQQEAPVQVGSK